VLGTTTRIRVVCLVVVPYHNAIELAKALATLDYVSGGRLVVLALVGYKPWEFELLGVPFAERGAILDEYLDAMAELWYSERPQFHGRHVEFADVVFDPRPVQRPLPLWMGGRTRAALRRLARIGDAWISYNTPRADIPGMLEYLRAQPEFQARPRRIDVSLPLFEGRRDPMSHAIIEQPRVVLERDAILEQVETIAGLGATLTDADTVLGTGVFQNDRDDAPPPTKSFDDYLERLHWFAEEILDRARPI
jgi:hypothetical protein